MKKTLRILKNLCVGLAIVLTAISCAKDRPGSAGGVKPLGGGAANFFSCNSIEYKECTEVTYDGASPVTGTCDLGAIAGQLCAKTNLIGNCKNSLEVKKGVTGQTTTYYYQGHLLEDEKSIKALCADLGGKFSK